MPYPLNADRMYRMPTHFGPGSGPRQGPDGRTFECKDNPKTTSLAVSFLTNPVQIESLLPGRGYNTLGVSFPARYQGKQDSATGNFLTVLWENLADPIITGREELGFAKIYCELPEPTVLCGEWHTTASWLGFRFLDIHINNLVQQSPGELASLSQAPTNDGTLHYKYMPRTGEWGLPDVAYACLTPAATPNRVIQECWMGQGSVAFHPARWEDMPTQYNIVNTFAGLEILEVRGASITKSVGGKDLSDQRILQ
jgi:hypothetical protein